MRCCCIHHIQYRIGDNTIERAHTFNVYRITPHYSTAVQSICIFLSLSPPSHIGAFSLSLFAFIYQ